jgi:uracil-DNA glycosylase
LSEARGKWKKIKIVNYYFDILTTFHPAFLLRQVNKKRIALDDFLQLKIKLDS